MDNLLKIMLAQGEGSETAQPEAAPGTEGTTQPSDQGQTAPDGPPAPKKGFDSNFLFVMVLMFVVIYLVMFRPQKKKQQHPQYRT